MRSTARTSRRSKGSELSLQRSHPSHHERLRAALAAAQRREGETVFDWLRDIIDQHPTGFPPSGRVELELD
jgi:hypothetical protein